MEKPGKLGAERKRGQVMVEYLIVLLSVVLIFFLLRYFVNAFKAYGGRALDLIIWRYP